MIERLFVIGGGDGVCEVCDGYHMKKPAICEYNQRLFQEAESYDLVTNEYEPDFIDETHPLQIPYDSIHTHPPSSVIYLIFSYLKNIFYILRKGYFESKDVTSIVFLPGFFSYAYILPVALVSDNIILYYGFDPYKEIFNERKVTMPIRLFCYPPLDFISVSVADLILYRDSSIRDRYNSIFPNTKFDFSNPLIDISKNNTYIRDDSCNKEPITLLYVGSLTERKGVRYLLDALAIINEKNSVELIIVGDGDQMDELKSICHQNNLNEIVEFTGHIADKNILIDHYRESDIFILPSLGEGSPRVVIEALSQSLPVIATDVGAISTRFSQEEILIIPEKDTEAIKRAVEKVMQSPELRQKLITNGSDKAKTILEEKTYNQHIRLINEITN